MNKPTRNIYLGLFIICSCLLIAELLLTRIFSVCIWHHFSFFVISITMFGLGMGGICVQLFPGIFDRKDFEKQLFFLAVLVASTSFIGPALLMRTYIPPIVFNMFGIQTVIFLSISFLLGCLPFFFGGVITALLFRNYSLHISKLYFCDLVGASVGCFATIGLLEIFGGPTALFVNSALAVLAAVCFLYSSPRKLTPLLAAIICIFSILFLGGTIFNYQTHKVDVKFAKGLDRRFDEFSKWNSISRIAVSNFGDATTVAAAARAIWGGVPNFRGRIQRQK